LVGFAPEIGFTNILRAQMKEQTLTTNKIRKASNKAVVKLTLDKENRIRRDCYCSAKLIEKRFSK
jgi:hypothetical protein